MQWHKND